MQFIDDFNKIFQDLVNAILADKMLKLKTQLLERYNVEDIDRVYEKYDIPIITKQAHRIRKRVENSDRCMARIGLGSQCSRSKYGMEEYCKSHITTRTYGRIDEPNPVNKVKRRGRKGKQEKKFTLNDLDMDKYLQAISIEIEGEKYLMDQNNVLYKDSNEIVGRIIDNTVTWY